jgi:hypothetical protein
MDQIIELFSTNDPMILYNTCIYYVINYQRKKYMLGQYLEEIINYFNNDLSNIINDSIHNISNLNYKKIYIKCRNHYLRNYMTNIYHNCKYNEDDTPINRNYKYINHTIISTFYEDKILQIKKFNHCIKFVDKVLNIFDNLPNIKYMIKGNLIEHNEIIYSNVCEEIDDDMKHLPPKKRYRKT